MSNDSLQPSKAEVSEAVQAMLRAHSALVRSSQPSRSWEKPPVTTLKFSPLNLGSVTPPAEDNAGPDRAKLTGAGAEAQQARPTEEALAAARETALMDFPEGVRAAARTAFEVLLARIEGRTTPSVGGGPTLPPPVIPQNLPKRRPPFQAPAFPEAGLDDDAVRSEWTTAHATAHEAHFLLDPEVLRAYANARLAREKWEAQQRGSKPSGDLRHPVPRNRLQKIVEEMTAQHGQAIARAEKVIAAIAGGDVARVEYFDMMGEKDSSDRVARRWRHGGINVPILIFQSDLDRRAAAEEARASRSAEEIEAEEQAWDEMIALALADTTDHLAELEVPDLPDWPTDRDPTRAEVAALSHAVLRHVRYVERGRQIEAQRQRDADIKARTAARRAAALADPEGAAAAKKVVQLEKAAERQRRWRERRKVAKDHGA